MAVLAGNGAVCLIVGGRSEDDGVSQAGGKSLQQMKVWSPAAALADTVVLSVKTAAWLFGIRFFGNTRSVSSAGLIN